MDVEFGVWSPPPCIAGRPASRPWLNIENGPTGLKRLYFKQNKVTNKGLARLADLDLQAATRKVDVEVREALVSLENQRASLKQVTVAHEVAKKNAAETAELYRQGLASALEVADANVSLFEAEVAFVQERYGLGVAFLNLEAALGLDPFGKEPRT